MQNKKSSSILILELTLFATLAGTLQLDLTALIKPATNARTCKLSTDDSSPVVDLFKQKRCYGFWAVGSMKTGTLTQTVV